MSFFYPLGSLAEAGSTSSLSTGGVLSPEAPEFSQDEGYSDDDSHYDDFSSDDGKNLKCAIGDTDICLSDVQKCGTESFN